MKLTDYLYGDRHWSNIASMFGARVDPDASTERAREVLEETVRQYGRLVVSIAHDPIDLVRPDGKVIARIEIRDGELEVMGTVGPYVGSD